MSATATLRAEDADDLAHGLGRGVQRRALLAGQVELDDCLDPARTQIEALQFLTDLDLVFPGALASATTVGKRYLAHLEAWPMNPLTKGSYTCYKPGQFTTLAGYEGLPAGPLHFAGEHANSFYVWQGFMEGAALSGIDAASSVLAMV